MACTFLRLLCSLPLLGWLQGFTEPEKFDPERFNEARKEDLVHSKHFLTFGFGPHGCVGREYATNHLVAFLAIISTAAGTCAAAAAASVFWFCHDANLVAVRTVHTSFISCANICWQCSSVLGCVDRLPANKLHVVLNTERCGTFCSTLVVLQKRWMRSGIPNLWLSVSADWTRRRTPKSDDWIYLPTVHPADSFITLHQRPGGL